MLACDLRPNVPGSEGSIHCRNPEVSGCEEAVGGRLRQGSEHVEKPAPEVEILQKADRRRQDRQGPRQVEKPAPEIEIL
jgi:hypothetical protein